MSYAIVYSSKTGNTKQLAEIIQETHQEETCLYCGGPHSDALKAQRIYIGFWTCKGACDQDIAKFLSQLTTQQVFLFGTAGFGGEKIYFRQILNRTKEYLPQGTTLIGEFMCQGKMPESVRQRYEAMEEGGYRTKMLENFESAKDHPNQKDFEELKEELLKSN